MAFYLLKFLINRTHSSKCKQPKYPAAMIKKGEKEKANNPIK